MKSSQAVMIFTAADEVAQFWIQGSKVERNSGLQKFMVLDSEPYKP